MPSLVARCLVPAGVTALAGLCVLPGHAHAQCQYEVTSLQFPIDCGIGTVITAGLSLNENGAVVGYYSCPLWKFFRPFLWTAEEGFTDLGLPPGVMGATAADINDQGVICGTMYVTGIGYRGFVYEDGVWTELPPVVDAVGAWSGAAAISNAGIVVGQRSLGENYVPYTAYIWSPDNGFTDLGEKYGLYSSARDVNEAGEAAISIGPTLGDEAYIWDGENLTSIGVIPGGFSSTPAGINIHDHVAAVGGIEDKKSGDLLIRSFLWHEGEATLLGVLAGYDWTTARGLNDLGIITGQCSSSENPNDKRAFLWQGRQIYDLNDLVPPHSRGLIERAFAVNNAGLIIADGYDAAGNVVTSLLTPIDPSPADLDGDCRVGIFDLLSLLAAWGPCDECSADLDKDGIVGILDLLMLLANWT